MTNKDRSLLRSYLNEFSDRWPTEYAVLYNKIPAKEFQLTIMYKYLKWARPDREEAMEVWGLIQKLEGGVEENRPRGRVRNRIEIEDITDGNL